MLTHTPTVIQKQPLKVQKRMRVEEQRVKRIHMSSGAPFLVQFKLCFFKLQIFDRSDTHLLLKFPPKLGLG